jgi:hypothetical protein
MPSWGCSPTAPASPPRCPWRAPLAALEQTPGASLVEIAAARVLVAEVISLAGRKEESVNLLASGVALARQTLGPPPAGRRGRGAHLPPACP